MSKSEIEPLSTHHPAHGSLGRGVRIIPAEALPLNEMSSMLRMCNIPGTQFLKRMVQRLLLRWLSLRLWCLMEYFICRSGQAEGVEGVGRIVGESSIREKQRHS